MALNEFIYGEISSSIYNISCDTEVHSILPEQQKYTLEVPGMDGVIDYGIGGYGVRVITRDIYFDGDYSELRANREQIIAWLSNINGQPKKLVFDNDPTRYYMAKVYAAISFENTDDGKIGTIQWECNPPWSYIDGVAQTPEEITWQTAVKDGNQYMQTFTAPGHMRFTNIGTLTAVPKIKLLNNIPAGLKLTYGGDSWQYDVSQQGDGIIIDSANQTVTRASDGSVQYQNVHPGKDSYFYFAPGQINIDVTATGLGAWPNNLIIIVEYTPQGVG